MKYTLTECFLFRISGTTSPGQNCSASSVTPCSGLSRTWRRTFSFTKEKMYYYSICIESFKFPLGSRKFVFSGPATKKKDFFKLEKKILKKCGH